MKTLTIGKRIAIIVALLGTALGGVGLFAILQLNSLGQTTHVIAEDVMPGAILMGRANLRLAESQMRLIQILRATDFAGQIDQFLADRGAGIIDHAFPQLAQGAMFIYIHQTMHGALADDFRLVGQRLFKEPIIGPDRLLPARA